ncbi:MAG: LysR family transcriptional regulator [Gammaproteobacteria bacterium]|nr:LysR family transcriptional regulator [Gammaproteobacteria bacterium]
METDPRLLRYLLAIHENGTFIRAANAERISQPALTNKINTLERQLGVKLVDRGRHGAQLNHFGLLLLRHARALDAVMGRASEEIALAKHGDSGPLVIGGTPISMVELVPRTLARLDQINSQIRISLIEADDDILLDKLKAGEIDMMLGGLISDQRNVEIVEEALIEFPLQAVVGKQNPLWDKQSVTLQDMVDHRWALPAAGSVIRSYVDAIFVSSGESMPTSYWSCSSMHGLKSVIQHTSRVSLMPVHAFSLEAEKGALKALKLLSPSSKRKLNILRLRHLPVSTLAEEFVNQLIEVAELLRNQ